MPKFEKAERVYVPGADGAQGVVIDITESIAGYPVYALRWLTAEGETMTGSCGEGDLIKPNRSAEDLMNEAKLRDAEQRTIERRVTSLVAARLRAARNAKRKR